MKKLLSFSIILVIAIVINSCSTVPIIGRKQLHILPESQMLSLSLTNYKAFLDTTEVIKSGKDYDMVKSAGMKISRAVIKFLSDNKLQDRAANFAWEYNLVKESDVNAWCMPGGKVVFYSGIMPVCQDEQGVAVVMGHEIAHAVALHGNERLSQSLVAQFGGMALDIALQSKPEETKNLFLNAYGIGTQLGVLLPYSRKHEYEADKLGLIFMTMAGYDPNKAVSFWERMSKTETAKVPEFLSTHPLSEKRIEELKKAIPEMAAYKTSK
ncbi:MAG: M48 family metallopeptidase [Prolixibacteraceae bacterium]|nr:M48 family metallopeptidase [Prolixibacteraceae bacterium]